jgi:TRAP-type C4-dicarboxylate transport system substrate-binding protein
MINLFKSVKRNFLTTTVVALLGIMTLVDTVSAADHNWRFGNLYGRGTAFGEVYKNLADGIEKRTGGKIKVDMRFAGEGVGQAGLLAATKSGLITMAAPFQSMHAGELPAGVVEIGLPGGTSDTNELYKLFHEDGWDKILKKAYGSQGLVWLEPYIQTPVYIITKKPINSVEDFKGLKIRAPGAYGKFLRNLGATPVSLSWGEIYTSLATGVIDGSIGSNLIDHRDGNHVEVAKYMYKLPLAGAQVLPIVVNKSAWNKLTPKLQEAVHAATVDHAKEQLEKSKKWEAEAVAQMEAKGLKWSPEPSVADKKAWKAAGASLWDEYSSKDKYCKELIDVLRAQASK